MADWVTNGATSDADAFSAWAAHSQGRLLRTAVLLTGHHQRAGDGDVQYSQVVVGPAGAAEFDWTGDVEVPGASEPGHYTNPEILVAGTPADLSVLGIGIDGRSKICCAPVGWYSHDFVLFGASSAGLYRVLAWRVGTPDLYRVSEYTDVPRQFANASWAEDAFTSFGQ